MTATAQTRTALVLSIIGIMTFLGSMLPRIAGAETLWVHARVEAQHSGGQDITYFRAFTTSDQAGNNRVPASRLCVKGIANQVQEKCEDNVSFLEVVERVPGRAGTGTQCAETRAAATSGSLQVSARAHTCQ